LLPEQPAKTLSTPPANVLDEVQRSWEDVRKRARVLLVLDVSGSMSNTVGSAGASKLELAKQAALSALGEFAPDDEVGVWIFSSDLTSDHTPWRELSRVSALGPKIEGVRESIRNLGTESGTALYRSVDDASAHMVASFDPERINGLVVLTDGQNDYADYSSIEPLLARLSSEPPDRAVRVFCIAYGADADMAGLQRISDASLGATYDASDPATIDEVFAAVLSNF
jgi:Ca-activated chloride channel family protein